MNSLRIDTLLAAILSNRLFKLLIKKGIIFSLCLIKEDMTEENGTRNVAYLLEDVLRKRYDYGFYQEELWEYVTRKETPVIEYDTEDVKHWIYSQCWSYPGKGDDECFVSIYQVLLQMDEPRNHKHIQRIKEANLQYPLIVVEDSFDKYGTILDGNHRFAKLLLNGTKKIKVQYISTDELMRDLYRKVV